jgi:bifunctional non-homologous end joining protein LigD
LFHINIKEVKKLNNEYSADVNGLKAKSSPLADAPVEANVKAWVQPKIVVEVKYYERTPNGILRFPDFLRERTDKKPSECTLKT